MDNNLKKYRKIAGLTQADLGRVAQIHRTDIVKLERGHVKAYPEWRRRISEALREEDEVIFPE